MEIALGFFLVVIAGLLTGSFMWPMKVIRKLDFEQYWFVGMLVGMGIVPWAVVLVAVPEALTAYKEVGSSLLIGNLLSIGWGIANILYGLCIIRIGAGLAGAILTSLGVTFGVLMPLIFKGTGLFSNAPDLFSTQGIMILVGLLVIVLGVVVMSFAGSQREKLLNKAREVKGKQGSFITGLIMIIIAGVLSSCISLSFVYSQEPIIASLKQHGASDIIANVGVWAGALFGGVIVNVLYTMFIMSRRRTWGKLFSSGKEFLLATIIGAQLIIGVIIMGRGMILLGILGASVGFGIQQSMQVAGNQIVGFSSGEWKGIKGKPMRLMYSALATIFFAIILLATANYY